jgi:hypothetical protein
MAGRIPGVFISHLPGDADQRSLFEHFKRTWGVRVMGIRFFPQSGGGTAALVDLENEATAEKVRVDLGHWKQQR